MHGATPVVDMREGNCPGDAVASAHRACLVGLKVQTNLSANPLEEG